jgi:hypothetical protein
VLVLENVELSSVWYCGKKCEVCFHRLTMELGSKLMTVRLLA